MEGLKFPLPSIASDVVDPQVKVLLVVSIKVIGGWTWFWFSASMDYDLVGLVSYRPLHFKLILGVNMSVLVNLGQFTYAS